MATATFTVAEDSSDEAAAKALKDLRRMVRYGKMAERALAAIRRDGFYDGKAPLAGTAGPDYGGGAHNQGKKKVDVRFRSLPLRLPVSREDLGPMSELRLEVERVKDSHYSGHECKEVQLVLCGPLSTQVEDGRALYAVEDDRRPIGSVRINKGHLSWLEGDYGQAAHRVYKEMKYAGAKESLTAFARGVSRILVISKKEHLAAAKTLDLQARAWEWFLADGHAERFFRDIHALVAVAQVMDS